MRCLIVACFFISFSCLQGQDLKTVENELCDAFSKIGYWKFREGSGNLYSYDSCELANNRFENLLEKYSKKYPNNIYYPFQKLKDSGVEIITSPDSNLRVYSWDRLTGGTYQYYGNFIQIKSKKEMNSYPISESSDIDVNCLYYDIDQVTINGKAHYLLFSYSKLSSGYFTYNAEIFIIKNKFLFKESIFKAKNKFFNDLMYNVDFRAHFKISQSEEDPNYEIIYDRKNKIISIPVIKENGLITNKRLKYKFNGTVFEYMPK